ncbi:MAG: fatty acid desaturase family protein [Myxococcota bacterium]
MTDWSALQQRLLERADAEGLREPAPFSFAPRFLTTFGLFAASYAVLLSDPAWPLRVAALAVTGFAVVQAGLLAHDAAHRQLTRDATWSAVVGHVCTSVVVGQSYNFWRIKHDRHHACTNEALDDPDIQTGIFVLAPGQAPTGAAGRWIAARQGWLLWPILWIQPYAIRVRGFAFALGDRQATLGDKLGLVGHFALWWALPAAVHGLERTAADYLISSLLTAPWIFGSFIWNHLGTRTLEPGERLPWFAQRLYCSRNLPADAFTTWLFGGLNHHVAHHLMPQVPTAKLRRARELVEEVCAEAGVEVPAQQSWTEAMGGVARHVRSLVIRRPSEAPPSLAPLPAVAAPDPD